MDSKIVSSTFAKCCLKKRRGYLQDSVGSNPIASLQKQIYKHNEYYQIKLDEECGYYITNQTFIDEAYQSVIYYRNQFQDIYTLSPASDKDKEKYI